LPATPRSFFYCQLFFFYVVVVTLNALNFLIKSTGVLLGDYCSSPRSSYEFLEKIPPTHPHSPLSPLPHSVLFVSFFFCLNSSFCFPHLLLHSRSFVVGALSPVFFSSCAFFFPLCPLPVCPLLTYVFPPPPQALDVRFVLQCLPSSFPQVVFWISDFLVTRWPTSQPTLLHTKTQPSSAPRFDFVPCAMPLPIFPPHTSAHFGDSLVLFFVPFCLTPLAMSVFFMTFSVLTTPLHPPHPPLHIFSRSGATPPLSVYSTSSVGVCGILLDSSSVGFVFF